MALPPIVRRLTAKAALASLLSTLIAFTLLTCLVTPQRVSALGSHKTSSLFKDPFGVALDSAGNLFVTDDIRNQVVKLSPRGEVLARWGKHGTGRGQFDGPSSIAIGPKGMVVIADENNNRVEEFSSSGKYLSTCCSGATAVGADLRGSYYIATSDPNWIYRYSAAGKQTAKWRALSPPNYSHPVFIAGDSQGDVYVTFSSFGAIEKFTPSGRSSLWRLKAPAGYDAQAAGVTVDGQQNVYVADDGANTISKLTPSGKLLGVWNSSHGYATDKGNFNQPSGLAVDKHENLFVADSMNSRVQKLSPSRKVLAVFK